MIMLCKIDFSRARHNRREKRRMPVFRNVLQKATECQSVRISGTAGKRMPGARGIVSSVPSAEGRKPNAK